MHESLGEIVGLVLETIGDIGASAGPPARGPRWLRWGCTGVLLLIVVGMLTISLWWPR